MSEPKFKIVLINHTFQINYFSRRWQLFAQQHPNVDVTLLAPAKYEWYAGKSYSYGKSNTLEGKEREDGNFHTRLFRMKNRKFFGWVSPDFKELFLDIKPDIIYHIGTHSQASLKQVLELSKRYLPQTKVLAFSMRGPALNLKIKSGKCNPIKWIARRMMYIYQKQHLSYVNRHCDAFFCHYPKAVECFRQEGYKGPIYMQTQVGVNTEWFHYDEYARKEIREKYNLGDAYVFGSATRFNPSKGIDDIVNAMPKDGNWKYLMMGAGSDEDTLRLKALIKERGLDDKIIMTGFVDWYDMTKYWNAIDCALHLPRTTSTWEETFSLSVVQAMVTGKPIIGSDSGSVPYQIGPDGMIVPEQNIDALREKIEWVLSHQDDAALIGDKMRMRVESCFTIQHLNDMFYETMLDVLRDKYDMNKVDMTQYTTKNYAQQ